MWIGLWCVVSPSMSAPEVAAVMTWPLKSQTSFMEVGWVIVFVQLQITAELCFIFVI